MVRRPLPGPFAAATPLLLFVRLVLSAAPGSLPLPLLLLAAVFAYFFFVSPRRRPVGFAGGAPGFVCYPSTIPYVHY